MGSALPVGVRIRTQPDLEIPMALKRTRRMFWTKNATSVSRLGSDMLRAGNRERASELHEEAQHDEHLRRSRSLERSINARFGTRPPDARFRHAGGRGR